jgi:hypothetical protein
LIGTLGTLLKGKSSSTGQANMTCHNKRKAAVRALLRVVMKGTG